MQKSLFLKLLKCLDVLSVVYFQSNLLVSAHPSSATIKPLLCSFWVQHPTALLQMSSKIFQNQFSNNFNVQTREKLY